jgi:mercuric ion binding protein
LARNGFDWFCYYRELVDTTIKLRIDAMKRLVMLLMILGLASAVLPTKAAEQTGTFAVEKMTCAVCPVTVTKAMEKVNGVVAVSVDLGTKTATVTFDDELTTSDAVAEASTNAGYPAKLIQTGG